MLDNSVVLVPARSIERIDVYVDGGCKNNGKPNAEAYGSFAVLVNGKVVHRETNRYDEGKQSNNVAEYKALLDALAYICANDKRRRQFYHIHSDSELVVEQVIGIRKVKDQTLAALREAVREATMYCSYSLNNIPRAEIVAVLGH